MMRKEWLDNFVRSASAGPTLRYNSFNHDITPITHFHPLKVAPSCLRHRTLVLPIPHWCGGVKIGAKLVLYCSVLAPLRPASRLAVRY